MDIAVEHQTLDIDYFHMTFPRELLPQSVADIEAYLKLFLERLKRRVSK